MTRRSPGYIRGENHSECTVCGFDYRASQFRRRWDGVFVCQECWEPQHPQEKLKARAENTAPRVVSRSPSPFDLMPDFPDCVEVTSPAADTTIATATSMTIAWVATPRATFYHVRVFPLGSPMTEPYVTTQLTYTIEGLIPATEYMVMVNAGNENGVGSTGLATSGQGRPNCGGRGVTTHVLPCPQLQTPTNGATLDDEDSAALAWSAEDEAIAYKVFVWVNGDPQPALPVTTTTDTTYLATGLDSATTYRWVVYAVAIGGYTSSGCSSRTFTTAAEPAVIEWQSATFTGDILGPSVTLVAVRSGNTEIEASADYDFTEGTALIGPDFTATPGTVTFAAGEVTKNVVVPLVRDYNNEVLNTTIDGGNGAALWAFLTMANGVDGVGAFADLTSNAHDFTTVHGEVLTDYGQAAINLSTTASVHVLPSAGEYSILRAWNGSVGMPDNVDLTWGFWWGPDNVAGVLNTRALMAAGGSNGGANVARVTFWIDQADSNKVRTYWANNGVDYFQTFATNLPLNPTVPYWITLHQDMANSRHGVSVNDGAIEWQNWVSNGPFQRVGDPSYINIGSSQIATWRNAPIGGKYGDVEVFDSIIQPTRFARWNLGASLHFLSSLSSPSAGTVIGATEDTTMTIEVI